MRRGSAHGRQLWLFVVLGALVLASAGLVAALAGRHPGSSAAADDAPSTSTVPVKRETLTGRQMMTGTVGFGAITSLANRLSGTYTGLPRVGEVVGDGEQLYRVDELPVIKLRGSVPAYRAMTGDLSGPDIRQLNEALRDLGFLETDPGDEFTSATRGAVKAWQKGLGLPETGDVDLGRVVFTPSSVRIAAVEPTLGDAATPGSPVMEATGTKAQVTISTDAGNRRFLVRGRAVRVTYPDGTSTKARLTSVGPVTTASEAAAGEPEVSAQARLPKPRKAASFQGTAVDVSVVTSRRVDVLTVPVTALLALSEGGYAVAVDVGTGRELVGVEVGLIVNDTVQVSAPELTAGTMVEVPSS